jgi:hypothetical protein
MPPPRSVAAAVQPMRLQRPAATVADALARLRQHIRFERFAASTMHLRSSIPPVRPATIAPDRALRALN